jgi:short-subunit dehydrogenase
MAKAGVVVTGGTKGIGKAIVEVFAAKGYDIFTCSRSEEDLVNLSSYLNDKYATSVHFQKVDVAKKEQVDQFAKMVLSSGLEITALVNNAGLFIPGKVHEEDDESLELMLDVNLKSAYWLSKALIPAMKEKRSGYIFNICSTASIMAYVNGGSYSISKFALYGMSKVLREELKEFDIRVSSVIPGATRTASWDGVDLPDERFMKPEDIAQTVWSAFSLSKNTVVEDIILRPQLGDI